MATKVKAKAKAKKKSVRRGRTSTSRVSSKNQVTIPVDILRKVGLKEGDEVEFSVNENGKLEVVPVKNPLDNVIGLFDRLGVEVDYEKEHEELWGR